MKKILFFVLLLFCFSTFCAAEKNGDFSLVKKVKDGSVNFTSSELFVTGSGIPPINAANPGSSRIAAEKAARKNAKAKAVDMLLSLRISGKTTVKAFFEGKNDPDFVGRLVSDDLFGEAISERWYSNYSVDMTFKADISGCLRKIADAAAADENAAKIPAAENEAETTEPQNEKTKSFLVITGVKIEPALLFSVIDEKGNVLYDISMGKDKRKSAASLFLTKKKSDPFTADIPAEEILSVKALKVKNGSEMVIRTKDAEKIAEELKKEAFEEGRIVLVSAE